MLSKWLSLDNINIVDSVDDWQQAIRLSAVPLLEKDIISPDYIQAIYQLHKDIGPYYVLAPGLAMPHARPEAGVNKMGLSMLVVKNGVNFHSADNDPVYVITLLAAPDNNSHLDMLTALADLFSEHEDMQKIFHAQDKHEVEEIINKY